ncbi:MAG TPA: glycosyltransferase family 39 protein [Nitrospirae bacterium]|nr:glycosyltransferase family 39 protein [Nitrospirota bacterium]
MNYSAFSIFLIGALLIFANLGSAPLFDVDEAVFAQASKEMLLSKDWINPTYNGVNRYDKPILIYWLMCITYSLFGVNEFSARLPSSLSGLLLALSLYFFSRKYLSKDKSIYVLIPLVFSPYFFVYTRAAVTDMTLTLFITLALLSFYSDKKFLNNYGFHTFTALAFLTKGLIGIVFPYLISIAFILFTKDYKRLKSIFNPVGIVIFLILSLPWPVAQYNRNGFEFIEQFFLKHHFQRYTDVISGHKGPFYYYLIAIIIGLLPWSFLLYKALKETWYTRKDILVFSTLWLLVVIGFFSLSTTKLPNYILPAVPAVVLLIGYVMQEVDKRWFKALIILSALSLSVLFFVIPTYAEKYIPYNLNWFYFMGAINIGTIFLFLLPNNKFGQISLRLIAIIVSMTIMLLTVAYKGLPLAGLYLQGDLKKYSLYAKERLKDEEKITVYKINKPSILFYSDRKIIWVGSQGDMQELLNKQDKQILITKRKFVEELTSFGFRVVEQGREYALLER